jgi:hypothetical protein
MSNTKAAVEVKQEGEFTLKGKSKPRKPKQLGNKEQEIQKVNIKEPLVEVEPDVKKVEIKNEEKLKKKTMPFKSEKQRRYLWKNHPEIAQRWENLYKSPTRLLKGFLRSKK